MGCGGCVVGGAPVGCVLSGVSLKPVHSASPYAARRAIKVGGVLTFNRVPLPTRIHGLTLYGLEACFGWALRAVLSHFVDGV